MSICLKPQCYASNDDTQRFCQKCGGRLLIQDRYRALRVIGQGAFGKTFLSQDEGKPSKPRCVIKQFIYNDPATLREAQRLFEQEAVRLDDLGKHSQIPELLAHAEQDGQQYLVQEFIDGENLGQELQQSGAFRDAKIQELLLDLLPVLQFIHAANVIHRDIKPENIIRRSSDRKLVLVDFGAAKLATQTALQKTGTTIGSAGYAAPEQAFGKAVFASDIYSLGVTCLHLLTNVDPLTMYDPIDGFAWRQFLLNRTVSDKLGKILDKMAQPSARERYQSVVEILLLLNPSPPQVPRPTSPTPPPQPSTGNNSLSLDCGNGIKLELVRIPAGKFMMGSNENDREKPIHEVYLKEFFMGKCTVTQKQWQAVMGNNPSHFKGENLPVEKVSWHEVRQFCQKLSQKNSGREIRLPTEAEWEYACRAGTTTAFAFGRDITADLANYACNNNKTVDVNSFKPNQWGLYQMHGNVWEWCLDEWRDSYSAKPDRLKRNGNEAWGDINVNENDNRSRLLRGGSWIYGAQSCRSAIRRRGIARDQNNAFGFRVVFVSSL